MVPLTRPYIEYLAAFVIVFLDSPYSICWAGSTVRRGRWWSGSTMCPWPGRCRPSASGFSHSPNLFMRSSFRSVKEKLSAWLFLFLWDYLTANEGPLRIKYKCLVPVPRNETGRPCHFPKKIYNVLSPNFHIHVSVSDLYIPRIGLPILLLPNRQTDPGNI